jgi:predicted small secreted protein
MKQVSIFLAVLFLITSCNFSKGVKKDLSTGLSTSYNGFAVEDVYLMDSAENRLNSNSISLGNVVLIRATGVENFQEKDGKAFPGCSILLTDKDGKEVLNIKDAYAELKDGVPVTDAKTLTASVTTGNPMVAGETYHLTTTFFDKQKTDNTITTNVDLKIK